MKTRAFIGWVGPLSVLTVTVCFALAAALPGFSAAVSAQALTPTGVWATTITPHDCTTKVPFPDFAFRALHTFHRDGTVTESVGTLSFAPGQRSIGHGNWAPAGGQAFDERTAAMILFTAGMFQAGSQVTTRTVTLIDANNYTGAGSSRFYDLNGLLYREGCATSVGVRLE